MRTTIKCNFTGLETLKVKQDLFNDEFLFQTVVYDYNKIVKFDHRELKQWIKQYVWCMMDYDNVDIKEIQRHLKEDWADVVQRMRKKVFR